MKMGRLLYENSVSYKGHLIIPFIFGMVESQNIYSYKLLSDLGHKSQWHKVDNPSGIYSSSLQGILDISKDFLDKNVDAISSVDYFKYRYTYRNNLIIIFQEGGKCFYDHYPPEELNNIAAPKLFSNETECISWVKQGLDRNYVH